MSRSTGITTGKVFGHFGETTEGVQKGSKWVISGIKLAESIIKCIPNTAIVTAPLEAVRFSLTCIKDVAGATNVFGRAKDWLDDKTREGIMKSTAKVISRLFLLAAQSMEFVWFFVTTNVLTLGAITSTVVGSMPIFLLIKNLFYIGSAAGSIVDAAIKIGESSEKSQHVLKQQEKWVKRKWEVMDHDLDLDTLIAKYDKKIKNDSENAYYLGCLEALQGENPVIDYKVIKIQKRVDLRLDRLEKKIGQERLDLETIQQAIKYHETQKSLEESYTPLQKDQIDQGKQVERFTDKQTGLREELVILEETPEELKKMSLKNLVCRERLYLREKHLMACYDIFNNEDLSSREKLTEYRRQIARYRAIEKKGESFEKNVQIWSKHQVKKMKISLKNQRQGSLKCTVAIIAESMKIAMITLGFFLMIVNPLLAVGVTFAINAVSFLSDSLQVTKMLVGAFASPLDVPEPVYA